MAIAPTVKVHDDLVEHSMLGTFRRTGIIRAPEVGEYYLGKLTGGVGIATQPDGNPQEILEKLPDHRKPTCTHPVSENGWKCSCRGCAK